MGSAEERADSPPDPGGNGGLPEPAASHGDLGFPPAPGAPLVVAVTADAEQQMDLVKRIDGSAIVLLVPDLDSAVVALSRRRSASSPAPAARPLPEGLAIDERRMSVTWRGVELRLTQYEHRLLTVMVRDPDRVWTNEYLHLAVWRTRFLAGASDLYSSVKRLRRKLESSGVPLRIESVRGVGFRLVRTVPET